MEPRISMITLGTRDLARDTRFYEAMGLTRGVKEAEGVSFFQMGGAILSLFPRADLAKDAGMEEGTQGFSGIALAYNTRTEDEVDAVLAQAERAGGRIVKPAQRAFWGGRSGYFADPSGHLWEVAHNPGFPLDGEGRISLPT